MQGLRSYVLPGVAAVVLGLLYLLRPASPGPQNSAAVWDPRPTGPAGRRPPRAAVLEAGAPARAAVVAPTTAGPAAGSAAGSPAAPTPGAPTPERTKADALRKRLASAARARKTEETEEADASAVMDKDYIRERIQEDLLPIAQECYESALEDDGALRGALTLQFTIVGSEDVGGVVAEVSLSEDSTITHADLVECMTESMMSVTFEPPRGDGSVTVTYPFVFEPGAR